MHAVDKTYVVWRREINYSILFYSILRYKKALPEQDAPVFGIPLECKRW
jgi:hypothetical protein